MTGTTKSLGQKDKFDKFYTKSEVVDICLSEINLSLYDTIIEPSAGNGSFYNKISKCIGYDIVPECDGIISENWFNVDKSQFKGKILIIGNPPFGENGKMALKFINESVFADTIAFILPRSFKKSSIQNKINLSLHLIKEIDLPSNSFIFNNESYDVPCVFQIWQKQKEKRKKIQLPTTCNFFKFVGKKDNPDFRIQRVGGNAGKASFNLDYAESSNYFIKNTSSLSNEDFVKLVNSITFPTIDYTIGPKSLSKGELIFELTPYF